MPCTLSREATLKALLSAENVIKDGTDYLVTRKGRFPIRLSSSMLLDADPRLPEAMDYIFQVLRYNETKILKRTLAHWLNPMAPAQPGYYFMRPIKIREIARDENGDRQFQITAAHHNAIVVRDDLELIGGGSNPSSHRVSETWLKQYYPEVVTKFDVLTALGYKASEVSKLALEVNAPSSTQGRLDIANLTFDQD